MTIATARFRPERHVRGLHTGAVLTRYFYEMNRRGAAMVSPKKVIRVLNGAGVSFVLMGTHGLAGWRSRPRATQDIDVLVAKKDHARAVRVLREAYPKLEIDDGVIVTRFKDPATGEPRIDVMKPLQKVYQMVFRHTQRIEGSHRVPDLEMGLISKFAAMVSPHRSRLRKGQDVLDFADMIVHNQADIDMAKLGRLANQVYKGGRTEITKLVEDILAGRPIVV